MNADILTELSRLFEGERDPVANAANCAAALFAATPEVNWVGFYFSRDAALVLGPFAGKPAVTRIRLGDGVCGMAATTRQTVRVADVHAFPGHIACDVASASEIVVPLLRGSALLGVLDLDSPRPDRFGAADQVMLEAVAALWVASCE